MNKNEICYPTKFDIWNSTIEEEDLKEQSNYWQNALIGFVVGDTPYQKSMENFVTNVWRFIDKPQTLGHDVGYYIL